MTPEQAMAEKRAYLHRVAVEEYCDGCGLSNGEHDQDCAHMDYVDSGSLSEDEEAERSGRPR